MSDSDFPETALADLPGLTFDQMRSLIKAQAEQGGLKAIDDEPGKLTIETVHGLIGLRPGTETGVAGMVAASDARWLFMMKSAVAMQMKRAFPATADAMQWSDSEGEEKLPPNFQFVRATKVEPLGDAFLRVTLQAEDISAHTDQAIHFRLVLPPRGVEPEWPKVAPNGSVKWPDGDAAPHKPVYSARQVDYEANTITMDVFMHEGGRVTEWAQEVMAGQRGRTVVGLMGPSGGGKIEETRVFMAADETGFPPAARLIEGLPNGATAHVILESEHGAACEYPMPTRDGVSIHWIARS
ncbi:MAG: siderophore-interacting protein, partial [Pseudomonadota bacterium]